LQLTHLVIYCLTIYGLSIILTKNLTHTKHGEELFITTNLTHIRFS